MIFLFVSAVADKVFRVSFVLSEMSWMDGYLNSSNPNRTTLINEILREVSYMLNTLNN